MKIAALKKGATDVEKNGRRNTLPSCESNGPILESRDSRVENRIEWSGDWGLPIATWLLTKTHLFLAPPPPPPPLREKSARVRPVGFDAWPPNQSSESIATR
ncbi:hypothetical protein V9T40_004659 [Parthenolecanium corni]|uniref:Uncharacterized protein n=1 Tax=Parthenolecanium corni TaxID=536013 RepID=A0AAN9Y1Z1_9HEMI